MLYTKGDKVTFRMFYEISEKITTFTGTIKRGYERQIYISTEPRPKITYLINYIYDGRDAEIWIDEGAITLIDEENLAVYDWLQH